MKFGWKRWIFPCSTNADASTGVRYLVTDDLTLTDDRITALYQKRWSVEVYHKSSNRPCCMRRCRPSPTSLARLIAGSPGVDDPRQPSKIMYPLPALLWLGVGVFLCHLGARRQVTYLLNLLAFVTHQMLEWGDRLYQQCRAQESLRGLWEVLRSAFSLMAVGSWQELLLAYLNDEGGRP